ncbi:MAG TPA: hypothetical protein VN456_17110 [Desulfosporosinus sp.]|nr:hypothetical protein [Desulfosporosinus sp.]
MPWFIALLKRQRRLSTQHCVSTTTRTTTRMSGNLGFDTYLVSNAIAAFELTDHKGTVYLPEAINSGNELATLHKEFAKIVTSDEILYQLKVH